MYTLRFNNNNLSISSLYMCVCMCIISYNLRSRSKVERGINVCLEVDSRRIALNQKGSDILIVWSNKGENSLRRRMCYDLKWKRLCQLMGSYLRRVVSYKTLHHLWCCVNN